MPKFLKSETFYGVIDTITLAPFFQTRCIHMAEVLLKNSLVKTLV